MRDLRACVERREERGCTSGTKERDIVPTRKYLCSLVSLLAQPATVTTDRIAQWYDQGIKCLVASQEHPEPSRCRLNPHLPCKWNHGLDPSSAPPRLSRGVPG